MSTFKQNTAVQAVAPGPEGPPWMNDAETYWASRLAVGEHVTVVQVSVICYFKFLSDAVATVRQCNDSPISGKHSRTLCILRLIAISNTASGPGQIAGCCALGLILISIDLHTAIHLAFAAAFSMASTFQPKLLGPYFASR